MPWQGRARWDRGRAGQRKYQSEVVYIIAWRAEVPERHEYVNTSRADWPFRCTLSVGRHSYIIQGRAGHGRAEAEAGQG